MLLITNNPKVYAELNLIPTRYLKEEYGDVLEVTKSQIIEEKSRLLTHPLSGSIKPNETYYKSIVLDNSEFPYIDLDSLEMIESAIAVHEKFFKSKKRPNWTDKVLEDFAYVDYYIMKSTFERMGIIKQ